MAYICAKCTNKMKRNPTLLTIIENEFDASYNYRRCQKVVTVRIKFVDIIFVAVQNYCIK